MTKFNHAYDFSFEVVSQKEDASDVAPYLLRIMLVKRVANLSDAELMEACGRYDTAEIQET